MSAAPLPSPMCSAALQYARAGWPVFPCRERDEEYQIRGETRLRKAKAPYTGAGVKDATTDEGVITGWWKRWPNAMIGVAMGHNGLFALDFDPRVDPETGEIFTLETLKAELEAMIGCALPVSLAAVTQSGGVHVYLKQPRDGGPEIRNRGNLPRHVDVRGIGGYVIAPPSVMTETGGRYRWLSGRQGMEPAEAPASLVEILRSKGAKASSSPTASPSPRPASTNGHSLDGHLSGAPASGRGSNGDDPVDQARRRYALTALDSELKELAATPIGGGRHGGRNRGIYFASLKLGGYIPGGWLSESVVRASLLDVIRAMPNNDDPQGAEKTMENGLRDGMASPHDMSGVGTRAGTGRQQRQHAPTVPGPDPASPQVRPRTPSAAPLLSSSQNGRVELAFAQSEGVRGRLKAVAEIWFARLIERPLAEGDAAIKGDDVRRRAFKAGLRVGAGMLDRAEVLRALDDRFAFLDGVAGSDIADGVDSGAVRDFDVGPMLTDMMCAGFPLTDLGNAERFRERHGRDFLYTTAKGWLGWDGRRYRVLNQEKDVTPAEVQAAVFETVRAIQNEAQFVAATGFPRPDFDLPDDQEKLTAFQRRVIALYEESPEDSEPMDKLLDIKGGKLVTVSSNLAKWGRASESSGRLGCIANLAKRWLTVEITDFDRNPMILNCPNGTLHFIRPVRDDDGSVIESARVELRPHDRGDLLTKLTACDYDAQAPAPEWQKFIRWAQPKRERRRYLRQWGGFNLTGEMGEQIFHIWWGPTAANGKSTAGNAMREAAGDYGDITNVETFLDEGVKKRGDQATPDIVRLPGVRFLTSGEPPKGAKINESLINSVTGGDPMLARDNFRSFFRFTPCFKWTLWCNSKPDIPQGTEGIWRRVKVLLWESHLEAHERDRTLPAKLAAEHPGILAWMVRGLIDWMDNGFVEPEDVTAQSEAYRDDSDPMASFLRLCTVEDPDGRVQSSHLYDVYRAWTKAAGEAEWRQKGFSRAMKDRGFDNKKSNGMLWLGLRLIKSVEDFVDRDGNVVAMGGDNPPAAAPQQPRPPRDFDPWREPDDDDVPY